jgi:hypothetical protein
VSRPMRFPSRTGRLFWLLFWLAVGPLVLIFPASAWLAWTLQPLQKVYLTTYAASSVGVGIPHSEMTIRWVMKTAPKRKPVPASVEDVVEGPDPKLPVSLSSKAIADGWRGVAYSAPEKVPADSLAKGLRDYVYDGVSVWWLFGRPMLNSLAVLMLLYVVRLQMKQGFSRRQQQEERHGRRTKGPELASALRWRGAKTEGIRFRLRFENALLRWLPFGPSYRIPKRLEASHILMMGDTGSGKTTTLAVIREGAEAQGYKVEGFAPTSRAAQKLADAGIETSTLQKHLARGQQPDTGERRLYVLDESSLASTKQIHEFVNRLHPNDRVLLVGDRRQHEAVEAGRPFAQLQDAGMKTVKLEEIVRQKDPELKQVVEQLARGEVREAVQGLERQGRVHEIAGREERIAAIAKEYAKSPEGTLVVSPDNRSRAEINERIHAEMQERGSVLKDEHRIQTLVPRQDLTGPERTWAARYEFNDVVRYARASKETGIERGEYARVKSVNADKNLLTVVRTDGSELTYDPRRQQGVSVYREEPRSFAVGDRVQFTAPANDLKIANRELGTVEAVGQDGQMRLKMDGGRDVQLDPREHPHLDHGYAVTSHSSQGQTAERVLIHVDTELAAKDLLNSRMAYVAVSRGAEDAQLFTNDREKLPQALGHDVSHESAHMPAMQPEQAIKSPQPEIAPVIEHGFGMGHSL